MFGFLPGRSAPAPKDGQPATVAKPVSPTPIVVPTKLPEVIVPSPASSPAATPVRTPKPTPETKPVPAETTDATPAPGSPERAQMMESLRTPVEQGYSQRVRFRVTDMKVDRDMAAMSVESIDPDSSDKEPPPVPGIPRITAKLRKTDGLWQVVDWNPVSNGTILAKPTARPTTPPTPRPTPVVQLTPIPQPPPPTPTPGRTVRQIRFGRKTDADLLSNSYPRTGVRMSFGVNYSQGGTIVDTVGLNAAPVGSFSLSVQPDGRVQFQVYDPKTASAGRISNGWHLLKSRTRLVPGRDYAVEVIVANGLYTLKINGTREAELDLPTRLSGQPIYLGDFPGDASWGPKYNIHQSIIGTVTLDYFGPLQR